MAEHCDFPPIKLNLREGQLDGTEFEQLLLREFLAYRILGVLTDKSYGARLLRVTFADNEGGKSTTRFAFFVRRCVDE